MDEKRIGANAQRTPSLGKATHKKRVNKSTKTGEGSKVHPKRGAKNPQARSKSRREQALDEMQDYIADRAKANAQIVAEMGEEADLQLKRLVESGRTETIQPAYVSVLTLALKRTGRLVDQVKTEHIGAVPIVLIPPKN
jgi:hypothetical protein